jgi:fatty acid desaturase
MTTMLPATALASGSNQQAGQMPAQRSDTDQVCIPNISTAERRKRLIGGIIQFGISLAILALLIAFGASRWWRLALFLPFGAAAAGFFQWRDRT